MRESKKSVIPTERVSAITELLLLFISFSVSFNIRYIASRPAVNMFGVENPSTLNPESNYLFILLFLASTATVFMCLKFLLKINSFFFKGVIIALIAFSFLIGVIAPGVAGYRNNVDTFHHGEQLAPAIAYEHHKKPYQDLFTLRGAGEDVITPWLSQVVFGSSIGSYYLLTGILQLLCLVVFFTLVGLLFKSKLEFLVVCLWFTSTIYGGFYYVRDIFVWVSVLLTVSILSRQRFRVYKLGILGFMAGSALFYSFDRGLFLSILLGMILAILVFFKNTNHSYIFAWRSALRRTRFIMFALAGFLMSFAIPLLMFGTRGLSAFIKTTFGEAAKYQGLIFNSPYPAFESKSYIYWLPIIVLVCLGFTIAKTMKAEYKSLSRQTMVEFVLFIFSLVFYRAASGRPDIGHIAYGSPLLFLLLFMVVFRRIKFLIDLEAKLRIDFALKILPLTLVFVAIFSPSITNYYRLALMNQSHLSSVKIFITSPKKPDSYWETANVQAISDYITSLTNSNDSLFVLSSDPIFYYTTKRTNPTRFSISWFADAAPLEKEMLNDLQKSPPKVILYESGTYYDKPEFISMKQRLPLVNRWILENYPNTVHVSGAIIRTK